MCVYFEPAVEANGLSQVWTLAIGLVWTTQPHNGLTSDAAHVIVLRIGGSSIVAPLILLLLTYYTATTVTTATASTTSKTMLDNSNSTENSGSISI